jgi:hypothetical protein
MSSTFAEAPFSYRRSSSEISADGRALMGRIQRPYPPARTSFPAKQRPEFLRELARQTIVFVSPISHKNHLNHDAIQSLAQAATSLQNYPGRDFLRAGRRGMLRCNRNSRL